MLMYDTLAYFQLDISLNYVYVLQNRTTIKRFIGEHEGSKDFKSMKSEEDKLTF